MVSIWSELLELESMETVGIKAFVVCQTGEHGEEESKWCQALVERGEFAVSTAFSLNSNSLALLIQDEIKCFVCLKAKK